MYREESASSAKKLVSHREKALLVAFQEKGKSALLHKRMRALCQEHLEELTLLAASAGANVVGTRSQEGDGARPATLVGKGFLNSLAAEIKEKKIGVVIFDNELTPTQNRNIETLLECKVIDRTSLILDIFAARARTAEGKIQVELAQMEYLFPRLVGRWMHFSRQEGGIGMRGPGETQLEVDRRAVKRRIQDLSGKLEKIRQERDVRREKRMAAEFPMISLVGYTNAGKSTLLNRLSGSKEYTDDRLFATLDPVTRRVALNQNLTVLMSDTVGFVQKLPHQLVAAFRATFEEIRHADLLLHVIDAASDQAEVQAAEVLRVLKELEADHLPIITVYNKIDLVPDMTFATDTPTVIGVSAESGAGIEHLRTTVLHHLDRLWPVQEIKLPVTESRLRAKIYREGAVSEEISEGQFLNIKARVPRNLLNEVEPFLINVKKVAL